MIQDSEKQLFDAVIVWKLDRFSRNRYDSAKYKMLLKKNGVQVVSATENISSGAEGILLESLLEGMAEYYSADLSEKIVRGMTENALKCKYNGGTLPVGYRIDDNRCFQIDPMTTPFVPEAYKRYDSGETMRGESGVSHTGSVYHYYKCSTVKKRSGSCRKKSVRKDYIEDYVVQRAMELVMDDSILETLTDILLTMQESKTPALPLYEQQLKQTEQAIQNLMEAIEMGILTSSTKTRLDELEAQKNDLKVKIDCEKLEKPRISPEFMTFWLHRFRKLDIRQFSHRKILVDTFVNSIYLYDDKMLLNLNFKEGTEAILFKEAKMASLNTGSGSDMVSCPPPDGPWTNTCYFNDGFAVRVWL